MLPPPRSCLPPSPTQRPFCAPPHPLIPLLLRAGGAKAGGNVVARHFKKGDGTECVEVPGQSACLDPSTYNASQPRALSGLTPRSNLAVGGQGQQRAGVMMRFSPKQAAALRALLVDDHSDSRPKAQ